MSPAEPALPAPQRWRCPMSYLAAYAAVAVLFLAIDAVALKLMLRPLFERHVGDMLLADPRLGVAAAFYALYCIGIVHFAVAPGLEQGSAPVALGNGALLGFLAYGTYEATNYATLRGWDWRMVAVDLVWGTALTAGAALAGYFAGRAAG